MRAARLAGQLDDGLPRGGMAVQTVEPEIDSGLVDLVDACACIEATTERPGAISTVATPVGLIADATGVAVGDVTPRAHAPPPHALADSVVLTIPEPGH